MQNTKSNANTGAELLYVLGTLFKGLRRGDGLWNRMPAIVILALVSMMSPISAGADVDVSLTGLFRSYPLSGIVEADVGYGIPLYGAPMTPFSGYIRPRLIGSSAAVYNSVDAALEIFPLAILGARAGGEGIQNDSKYSAYNCELYRCTGSFYRTYFEAQLSLGAGPVFAQGRWRREHWSQKNSAAGDFIDPTSGLAMLSHGDSQTVMYGVLGVNLNPTWAVLGILRYAESGESREISRTPVGMLRYKSGQLSAGVGAGFFESALKKRDFTIQSFVRWEFAPSLAVH